MHMFALVGPCRAINSRGWGLLQGLGLRLQGSGLWAPGSGIWVPGSGFWVLVYGFWVSGLRHSRGVQEVVDSPRDGTAFA